MITYKEAIILENETMDAILEIRKLKEYYSKFLVINLKIRTHGRK